MYQYSNIIYKECTDDILLECSELFSNHYGIWKTGNRVKLSPYKLKRQCMFDETCNVSIVRHDGHIVGHCFYTIFNNNNVWITQLVVHSNYRNIGMGTSLMSYVLGNNWNIAAIVSSNPYAIRGFERAAGHRCSINTIKYLIKDVIDLCPINYITGKKYTVDSTKSVIDTEFYICHVEIDNILISINSEWIFGNILPDGYEFIAIIKNKYTLEY